MKKVIFLVIVGCGGSSSNNNNAIQGVNAQKTSNSLGYYGRNVVLGNMKIMDNLWGMTVNYQDLVYILFGDNGYFVSMDDTYSITDNSKYGVSEDGKILTMHDSVENKNVVIVLGNKKSSKCYSMTIQHSNEEHKGVICYEPKR